MDFRVGLGYDVHQLQNGNCIVLGGVEIPSPFQIIGHSDGDALIHAICDSFLGALNLGDIGEYFPSDADNTKGMDSGIMLRSIYNLVLEKQYGLNNLDCNIILQKPNLSSYKKPIANNLASLLQVESNIISIKAKTNDNLGYVGKSEGIEVQAICMLRKLSSI